MNANEDRAWGDLVIWDGTLFSDTFEERLAAASAGGLSSVSIAPSAMTPPPSCAPPLLHGANESGKEREADDER